MVFPQTNLGSCFGPLSDFEVWGLEAQQRYFSYRAILVAIVSQNSFVLAFMGYRTIIARNTLQNGVSHKCACVKLSTKGEYRTILGGC